MQRNPNGFIPSIPLLVRMGLNNMKAERGMMPGEKYVCFADAPEDAAKMVCLWNDGTIQVLVKSSGWGYRNKIGPFDNEGDFLRALTN